MADPHKFQARKALWLRGPFKLVCSILFFIYILSDCVRLYIYTRWPVAATLANLLREQSIPFHFSLLFTLRRWSLIVQKFPLQLRLQPFARGKYRLSLCHFRLLFTLRRWGFVRKFPLQLLPKKSIQFRSYSLLAFSVELLVTLDLTLATEFSTVRKHGLFFNCFRVGPSISNLKSFRG